MLIVTDAYRRASYLGAYSEWAAWVNERCRCNGQPCRACQRRDLRTEAICLELDMAVALAISGPGPRPATRLAAVDAAREAGVAWA